MPRLKVTVDLIFEHSRRLRGSSVAAGMCSAPLAPILATPFGYPLRWPVPLVCVGPSDLFRAGALNLFLPISTRSADDRERWPPWRPFMRLLRAMIVRMR